jgi:hypothetical protein
MSEHICPICQDKLDNTRIYTPCIHGFHKKCLIQHLLVVEQSDNYFYDAEHKVPCPICRNDIHIITHELRQEEEYKNSNQENRQYNRQTQWNVDPINNLFSIGSYNRFIGNRNNPSINIQENSQSNQENSQSNQENSQSDQENSQSNQENQRNIITDDRFSLLYNIFSIGRLNSGNMLYNQPAQQTNQPAQQTNQPAQQTNQPAQQTNQPAQQVNRTAQQTNQPAQQTNQPAQQVNQPAPQDIDNYLYIRENNQALIMNLDNIRNLIGTESMAARSPSLINLTNNFANLSNGAQAETQNYINNLLIRSENIPSTQNANSSILSAISYAPHNYITNYNRYSVQNVPSNVDQETLDEILQSIYEEDKQDLDDLD